ncbi:hypothetical protein MRB53_036614 [Persea americana]|nr:hypothetical protein MRB53_042428 [Persea americana]KAJ8611412.1 hypothetical protein MRB53_037994 [Persea americana]KAJ8613932.1 hypothetical protein MRB53_036786 [Persea americana]KAJ8614374.1 hypothetical protein MRB53_036572 [Persea americana]KAJ8614416.1 hypothetical protein MRB53_036614 [Persea americana]
MSRHHDLRGSRPELRGSAGISKRINQLFGTTAIPVPSGLASANGISAIGGGYESIRLAPDPYRGYGYRTRGGSRRYHSGFKQINGSILANHSEFSAYSSIAFQLTGLSGQCVLMEHLNVDSVRKRHASQGLLQVEPRLGKAAALQNSLWRRPEGGGKSGVPGEVESATDRDGTRSAAPALEGEIKAWRIGPGSGEGGNGE